MHSKPTFAIGIPTINRYDLLQEALNKYSSDFPNTYIFILDNGRQGISRLENNIQVMGGHGMNMGVAASWNILLQHIFVTGHTHALILNDDIYLGKKEQDIQKAIQDDISCDLFVSFSYGMCSFIMPKQTVEDVGMFDVNIFPAYYEDNDMMYRIKLSAGRIAKVVELDPFIFRRSKSIEKEPKLNQQYLKNRDYYVEKWGGSPDEEKYTIPFNNPAYVPALL